MKKNKLVTITCIVLFILLGLILFNNPKIIKLQEDNIELFGQKIFKDETPDDTEPVVKKVIYVNSNSSVTAGGVTYPKGSSSNDGLTPQNAVDTLVKAYSLLDSNLSREEQYIVIMGNQTPSSNSGYTNYNESNTNGLGTTIFNKPATITGQYNGVDYNGKIILRYSINNSETSQTGNFLYADTTFENIKIGSNGSAATYIFCQGRDLTIGEGVDTSSVLEKKDAEIDNGIIQGTRNDMQIFAGWQSYNTHVTRKDTPTNIVIKSGNFSRVGLANRMGVAYAASRMGFSKNNPFNVKLTIDYAQRNDHYTYDITTLYGGNGEGSAYINSEIDLKNGRVGRLVSGNRGNDVKETSIPGNTFFGSTTLNMTGGSIYELFGASLGSSRTTTTSGYNGYKGNYQFGKIDINISGGTIGYRKPEGSKTFEILHLYLGAGGAVTGYSDDSTYGFKSMVKNQTMNDMNGNTYNLDEMKINLNITGGTIYGNIYGGGYGWSDRLQEAQLTKDAGYVYGDVNMNISGGTVKGDIYGGGRGRENYGGTVPTLASLVGSTSINITGNPTLEGTIFGGGQGFVTYPDMAKVVGDVNINIESDDLTLTKDLYGGGANGTVDGNVNILFNANTTKTIYGGGNAGNVNGDITLNVENSKVEENIYGGGKAGEVLGNVFVNVKDTDITDTLYGGGYSGNVGGTVSIDVDNSTGNEIYGGGYSGTVGAYKRSRIGVDPSELREITEEEAYDNSTASVVVKSGEFTNIFGGGNLGQIVGCTYVEVGSKDKTTIVDGVVYGGGRGVNADAETVTEDSVVFIEEKTTDVENYGSTKLGKVVGKVYLTFKNYYLDNPTSKYKRMNGIDRATTVRFSNSYVLLENMVNGELKGIEDIKNIILPSGSGLKISADGEISGDFVGGGELYLDSEVCLTVDNDISGVTTLVLNPKLQQITGGIEHPYLIVKGDSEATDVEMDAQRLISGDELYVISTQRSDITNNDAYYYLASSIIIEDYIIETTNNDIDRNYNTDIEEQLSNIEILNNSAFTSLNKVVYSFLDDGTKGTKFKNMSKFIELTSSEEIVSFPIGTTITMITPTGEYYYYKVETEFESLDLGSFKSFNDNTPYNNVFNIEDITDEEYVTINPVSHDKTYLYDEEYRFIVDFSNTTTKLCNGNYFLNLKFKDSGEDYKLDKNSTAGMVNVSNREYTYTGNSNEISSNGTTTLTTKLTASKVESNTYINKTKVNALVSLKDSENNLVNLPDGTKVIINGQEYKSKNGKVNIKLAENMNLSNMIERDIEVTLDFTEVIETEKLNEGTYNLEFELYTADNEISDTKSVLKSSVELNIYSTSNPIQDYGFRIDMINDSLVPEDKKHTNKYKIITLGNEESRTYKVTYNGNFTNAKVRIYAKERQDVTEYVENANTNLIELSEEEFDASTKTFTAKFNSTLPKGTYRIYAELVSANEDVIAVDYSNLVVID